VSGYDFHPEVANDVANIAEYTARNTSLDAAARILDEILEAMALLGESPGIGRRREDLTTRPVRFWAVYDYLIAYVPDEHTIWVVAVLHGSRNPRLLTAILRQRG